MSHTFLHSPLVPPAGKTAHCSPFTLFNAPLSVSLTHPLLSCASFPPLQVIVAYYDPDTNAMRREVNKYALVFVGLGAFSLAAYTLQHFSFGVVGEHLTRRVREAMLRGEREKEGWHSAIHVMSRNKHVNNSGFA